MKAVILVGGLGTRLRPFTFSIPKPLLPVGETPILQIIIEQLRECDIRDIILATGYQADLIQTFCGNGSKFGVNIDYVHESRPLGTAGPLSLMRDLLEKENYFILMNGDVLTKLDFNLLVGFSQRRDVELTIGYTTFRYQSPFGVLSVKDDMVTDIVEKPSTEYLVSAGIYAMRSTSLDLIPEDRFFTVPQLVNELVAVKRRVGAYHIRDFWIGLESISHFDEAMKELSNIRAEDVAAAYV